MDAIDRLLAIEDIKHLKSRYFRYVDSQDWSSFTAIFTVDVQVQIDVRHFNGRKEFIKHTSDFLTGGVTFHHGHMPEIDVVSPDEATGVWTLFDRVEPLARTGRRAFSGYGRYWERYRREPDGWKIASLRLERLRLEEDLTARAVP